MAKAKVVYVCEDCGWESPKWAGQCRECRAWGTLKEFRPSAGTGGAAASGGAGWGGAGSRRLVADSPARPVTEIDLESSTKFPSGVGELDRVLGQGITPGAVMLLAGEPGVGKSTLLLDVAARFARMAAASGRGPVLYVTGEESVGQVRARAERIGALAENLLLAAENDVEAALAHIEQSRPALFIVDSVQTLSSSAAEGAPGGVNQVKAVTGALIAAAKDRNIPAILVGHVTKEGTLAGPRTLEHLVDVVCQFEGDRHSPLRLLRATKNRYGATDEVGCFRLTDLGIAEVPDPSSLFVSATDGPVPGSCLTVTLEGIRPLIVEVQALVTPGGGGNGRRIVSGLDSARMSMVLAVVQDQMSLNLRESDVYLSTVGGAKAGQPAVDLAAALAVISANKGQAPPAGMLALGEIGLTGDIRGTTGLERRLQEAARLGMHLALVPAAQAAGLVPPRGMRVAAVRSLRDAAREAFG